MSGRERILVAMSGGVDSSVAAAEAARSGAEVVGVTLRLWGGPSDSGCCAVSDVEDARRVADALGVEHLTFAMGEEFEERVVGPYVADHAAGRTPNPCVECNRTVKFADLLRRARALGFDALATGHHARIVSTTAGPRLGRGADLAKDQSYVLYPLTSTDLSAVRFPIGGLTKAEVRARATDLGLRTADKPDSQDVCFITRADGRRAFLEERIELTPGEVVDTDGQVLGRLDAIEMVTPGQRRGLGLPGGGPSRYVLSVDRDLRRVVVGDRAALLDGEVVLERLCWAAEEPGVGTEVTAQTSAHGEGRAARWLGHGRLEWDTPRRRVASGQSVVLYGRSGEADDVVLGGGIVV